MGIIRRCQKEYVTYWEITGYNDFGEPVWSPPAQMKCRWDDTALNQQSPHETTQFSSATLITEKPLKPGDVILRGKVRNIPYEQDPRRNPGAFEVLKVSGTPTLRYNEYLYEAYV